MWGHEALSHKKNAHSTDSRWEPHSSCIITDFREDPTPVAVQLSAAGVNQ